MRIKCFVEIDNVVDLSKFGKLGGDESSKLQFTQKLEFLLRQRTIGRIRPNDKLHTDELC